MIIDFAEWISMKDWRSDKKGAALLASPAKSFASTVLDKLWKRVTRGGNLVDLDDEARHQLRITAKKLRYAAGMGKAETKRHKRFITAMEGLQDQLGSLNDLATAPDMLSKLALSGVPAAGDLVSAADKGTLLNATAEADDAFVDAKRFWR
ncbi:CHAD domain-containing protein [Sinorhizobium meliloti]|uniref:CHAD domain-containing protein n=1 Tax=Rhizobium meliloti TaxID=382 RepID=UPI001865879B|nr:CHAD domain-containing protein [Sinorhizobium meliloti]